MDVPSIRYALHDGIYDHHHNIPNVFKKGEEKLWKLVKIQGQSLKTGREVQSWSDNTLYFTDTVINLMSILLKLAIRLPLLRINKKEINTLFSTTLFNATNAISIEQIEERF